MPIELNFVGKKNQTFLLRKTQNFRDIKRNYLEKSVSFAEKKCVAFANKRETFLFINIVIISTLLNGECEILQ